MVYNLTDSADSHQAQALYVDKQGMGLIGDNAKQGQFVSVAEFLKKAEPRPMTRRAHIVSPQPQAA